jgi:succinate dehydrogenase/fumarate reductase cytochrome b subunit
LGSNFGKVLDRYGSLCQSCSGIILLLFGNKEFELLFNLFAAVFLLLQNPKSKFKTFIFPTIFCRLTKKFIASLLALASVIPFINALLFKQ